MASRTAATGFRDAGRYILLSLFALAVLIPFASIVTSAFNPPFSLIKGLQVPDPFTFESFVNVWTTASFGRLLLTSLTVAACVVPLAAVVSTLAGFAIAHLDVFAGKVLLGLFVFGLVLPTELTVIPLYFDMRSIGLTDTLLGVILAEIAAFMPFGVFWMHASFRRLPARAHRGRADRRRVELHRSLPYPAASVATLDRDHVRALLHVVVEPVPADPDPDLEPGEPHGAGRARVLRPRAHTRRRGTVCRHDHS